MDTPQPDNKPTLQLRGLYKNVKISVKTLDTFIVIGIIAIVVLVIIGLQDPGFTITFDSRGGTDVPAQNQMYGQLLEAPEPPTREGYIFTGWYKDPGCDQAWNIETDTVETDMTLYAGWEPIE